MKKAVQSSPCANSPASKRLAARRDAFLEAGREVFQEKGFADATLDDVIAKSGGSRQTLYALFGGKQGLFEAIVSDNCETIYRGMALNVLAARPPAEVLEEIGIRYLTIVTSPDCLSLNRMVISEAPRMPELAQRFWSLGPGYSRNFLAAFFESQMARGSLRLKGAAAAADQFIEMLSGTVRMQCLIGLRPPPTKSEVKKIVQGAVSQFLDGCRGSDQAAETFQPRR
jgi:TetR/AcrR family transcriptional regulator, mexJK operon transcriptional repressor